MVTYQVLVLLLSRHGERFPAIAIQYRHLLRVRPSGSTKMIDDTDLGFFANFLGISIFVLLVAYHYVVAEPKVKA